MIHPKYYYVNRDIFNYLVKIKSPQIVLVYDDSKES